MKINEDRMNKHLNMTFIATFIIKHHFINIQFNGDYIKKNRRIRGMFCKQ